MAEYLPPGGSSESSWGVGGGVSAAYSGSRGGVCGVEGGRWPVVVAVVRGRRLHLQARQPSPAAYGLLMLRTCLDQHLMHF